MPHINPPTKADRLQAQIDRLQAELDRVALLPGEPDNDPNVIWFEKTFGGNRAFTYAAVKAGDGYWYTTGPKTPKSYLWQQLIEWIYQDEADEPEIWLAGEFETIN